MEIKVLTLTIHAFKLYVLCISIWKVFRLKKEYEWSLTYLVSHLCEKLKVFEVYSVKYRVEWTFSPSNTSKLKKKGIFWKDWFISGQNKIRKMKLFYYNCRWWKFPRINRNKTCQHIKFHECFNSNISIKVKAFIK